MSYTHFTLSERICLQKFLVEGKKIREIARLMERSPSSISREVRRNFSKKKNRYNAHRATVLYIIRRRNCVRKPAIQPGTELYNLIKDCLEKYWPPETIAQYCKKKGHPISFSTIYYAVKAGVFSDIQPKTHFRRRGKKKHAKHGNHATIHPEHTIHDRPSIVDERLRIGDWEGDTVYGGIGKGLLVTLVERKTRFLCACRIRSRDASETRIAIQQLLNELPVSSLSLDNGTEFAQFKELEEVLQAPIYFAEPHKPWQRGSNENMNGILRFFFPKGFDFHSVDDSTVQAVVDSINDRPRKCLDWSSPSEVFGVALT